MIHAKYLSWQLPALGILALVASGAAVAQSQAVRRTTPAPAARPAPAPVTTPVTAPVSAPASGRAPSVSNDVPRASYIQSMDADYRKRDLDGDGKVTRAEVEQFERSGLITAAQTKNRAVFTTLDTDRNGVLTPGEFAGLVRNVPAPDVTGQMQRLDLNRDQVVSLVEYRTAMLVNFDRLDADKDGIVTERELAAPAAAPPLPAGR